MSRRKNRPARLEVAEADKFLSPDYLLPSETGVVKSGVCGNCGRDLPGVMSAYGSIRKGVCLCRGGGSLEVQQAAAEEDPKPEWLDEFFATADDDL